MKSKSPNMGIFTFYKVLLFATLQKMLLQINCIEKTSCLIRIATLNRRVNISTIPRKRVKKLANSRH